MTPTFHANPFAPAISFWCSLWQAQLEQSLKMWGAWAQYIPHENAAELAAEAAMLAPVVRTTRPGTATRRAAPKPVAEPAAPKPARAPRTTPAKAKAGSEDPASAVVH